MTDAARLVLGTVQLGLPYGRRAGGALLPEPEAHAILDAAWALGIRCYDTAHAYGDAAERLARWIDRRRCWTEVEVITKVRVLPRESLSVRSLTALAPFHRVPRRTLLTHGPVNAATFGRLRRELAGRGLRFGQSVYGPEEVRRAVTIPGTDRVQAPGNVLDERALRVRKAGGPPLDLRSIFLQGVLLDSPEVAEDRVTGAGEIAAAIQGAAQAAGESAAGLLLAAMHARLGPADRLVIGVDTVRELEPLAALGTIPPATVERFCARVAALRPAPSILDPREWGSRPATSPR